MSDDRPITGIALMLGFCIVAPLADAVAKLLADMPMVIVILVRFGLQSVILVPIVFFGGRTWQVPRAYWGLLVMRTVLHMLGIGLMFTALQQLPLADAIAIAFVCPFILLLLGRLFLNEQIGIHRIGACAVGFVGAMMVIQPSFAEVGPAAFLPLAVAVLFAFFILSTRKLAKAADPLAIQTVSGAIACVLILPVLLLGAQNDIPALQLIQPSLYHWVLLLSIGALGTLAHLLMTWSLRYAPSATLAPMQYIELPVATIIGWVVFNQFPNTLAGIGIVITMLAGFYAIWREQITAGRTATPQAVE